MELLGRIIEILPEYTSNSGKKKFSFLLETQGQYPQTLPFEVWGEEKWSNMRVVAGANVSVSFDINGREYNGKHYISLQAWKVMRTDGSGQQAQQSQSNAPQPAVQAETVPASAPAPEQGDDGQLPF